MENTIIYTPGEDLVTVAIQGRIDFGSTSKMLAQLAGRLKETNCLYILVDVRSAQLNMSLLELLTLPGMILSLARDRGIDLKPLRRAMVSLKDPKMLEVFEILTRSLGGNFRRFHIIEEAKTWLKQLPIS